MFVIETWLKPYLRTWGGITLQNKIQLCCINWSLPTGWTIFIISRPDPSVQLVRLPLQLSSVQPLTVLDCFRANREMTVAVPLEAILERMEELAWLSAAYHLENKLVRLLITTFISTSQYFPYRHLNIVLYQRLPKLQYLRAQDRFINLMTHFYWRDHHLGLPVPGARTKLELRPKS